MSVNQNTIVSFLRSHSALSDEAIALATKTARSPHLLPMVLWQYGLLTLEELDQIFEWMDTVTVIGS